MVVAFKLSFKDITRRVTFPERPTWTALSARIILLYGLSPDDIGVCYTDVDGDSVTLNSEEELQDFYLSSPALRTGQDIKFRVVDLTSIRHPFDDNKPLPNTPRDSSSRNTFGGTVPLMYEVEDDWQFPLGLGARPFPPPDGSAHAFVETVDGSTDSSSSGGVSRSETPTIPNFLNHPRGKGKERAPTSTSSSVSVIDNDSPAKPPVHVQVHSLRGVHSDTFGAPPAQSTPVDERSPPTLHGESIPSSKPSVSKDNATPTSAPDPPTPVISPPPLPSFTPTASLSNDVAALLNSVSDINNGSYWAEHRESVARAADDIRRAAQEVRTATVTSLQDVHRAAEEEAGRRVTEALGNIVRVFGDISIASGAPPTESEVPPPPRGPWVYSTPGASASPHVSTGGQLPTPIVTNWAGFPSMPPSGVPVPPPVPPTAGFIPPPGVVPFLSPVAPPSLGTIPGIPPISGSTQPTSIPAWSQFRPLAPPVPPVIDTTPVQSQPAPQSPQVSYYTASPVSPTDSRSRPRRRELKASLEAAKETYNREKERYRAERQRRYAELEQRARTSAPAPVPSNTDPVAEVTIQLKEIHVREEIPKPPSTPPPTRRIVSNARNGFPQLEIVSLPVSPRTIRRQNTISSPVRPADKKEIGSAQATQNVVERLGDVSRLHLLVSSIISG
ncbi:hypothetical protein OF83DRAFT_366659 [Amylostereum chailletii]|nr:hypothetical protein OF83DRAFT_366659 [Amylostereum chailletii]